MNTLSFTVAQTQGPLDLILQLISQHKLDIYDIEITKLLEQYMEYIRQWQETDMEVASEFLEMASRLVYIKSVSLLPKHEELEKQLKSELTGQLIEYTVCRQVAQMLKERYQGDGLFFREPQVLEKQEETEYTHVHKKEKLLEAYLTAIGKRRNRIPDRQVFDPLIARRVVPVSSCITVILNRLYREHEAKFLSLFENSQDRSEIVATFLAVLELAKNRRIIISTDGSVIRMNDIV